MSGGSYDYAFRYVDKMAEEMSVNGGCDDICAKPALRRAFKEHLRKVAKAMRAIEWNDSVDGDNEEPELIRACISDKCLCESEIAALRLAISEAEGALDTLLEARK